MVAPIGAATISSVSRGLCPHGLPFSACPICSGKGGGGGSAVSNTVARAARPGEMSYDECYAIGQMLKAQKERQGDNVKFQSAAAEVAQQNRILQTIANKAVIFANFVQANIVTPVTQIAQKAVNAITQPIVRIADAIVQSPAVKALKNIAQKFQQGAINITDKLAAVFGEPMNAIAKFLGENWKKLRPKKFIFFKSVDDDMEHHQDADDSNEFKRWLKIKPFKLFKKNLEKTLCFYKKGSLNNDKLSNVA